MRLKLLLLSIATLLSACATSPKHQKEGLDRDEIARVMESDVRSYVGCYSNRLKQRPKLKGTVVLAFIINENGQVKKAKIASSTMDDHSVEQCISNVVKNAQFPEPAGNVQVKVTYPFMFKRFKG